LEYVADPGVPVDVLAKFEVSGAVHVKEPDAAMPEVQYTVV
jgi:hypothetical protein